VFNLFDKLLGFFDRRFIIAYWAPVAIWLLGLALIIALDAGFGDLLKQFAGFDPVGKIVLATTTVVAITVIAYALQALTGSTIRLYEGYSFPGWLMRVMRRAEIAKLKGWELREATRAAKENRPRIKLQERYFYFPPVNETAEAEELRYEKVRATRLGNAMTAAEEYPRQVYGLDSVLWWPRLATILPEKLQNQVDAAIVPMISLLNLCTASVLLAIGGAVYMIASDTPAALFTIPLWGGFLLARICYRAAVSQAVSYGNVVRVAYDFHRHEILQKMKLKTPDSLDEELAQWLVLNNWIYYYDPPWNVNPFDDMPMFNAPFSYAKETPADGEPTAVEAAVVASAIRTALAVTAQRNSESGHD
jgi:hypothetical protein